MAGVRRILTLAACALVAFVLVTGAGLLAPGALAGGQSDGPAAEAASKWPGHCVADPATMRRSHFEMLLHQRDETMHLGERPTDRGLGQCLTCHAVKGDDGQPVTVADSRHFCRTCHDSAAVRIDCFTCHNSAPGRTK